MISIDTIGAAIDRGYGIRVSCSSCGHNAKLDLPALAERLGRDQSILAAELLPKLKCGQCQGKKLSMTLSPYHRTSG